MKKKMPKNELLNRLSDVGEFYYREMYEESPEKARNLKAMAIAERFLEQRYPERQAGRREKKD